MYNQTKSILTILVIFLTISAHAQDIEAAIKAKPFTWTGSVGAGTEFYASNASIDRYSPFTWQLNGNFTMTLFEAFSMPFSFTIGKQVKEFKQPFFQMGISPSYKWATLHAGYRNMTFNPYTLNGATFAGVGLELNPAWFRLATMFGRFAKANEVDPSSTLPEIPAYRRLGYGTKIGFGKENNYIDLSFFKAKDDSSSITRPEASLNIRPEDNMSFGVSIKQVMWKSLTFTGDYGLSFFTADQGAAPGEEKTPLKGNSSTSTGHAVKATLGYAFPTANLGFSYERVDPGYRSLGAYYFSDDFEHILLTPSWSMWKQKVMVNVSAGVQRNNLKADKDVRDFRFAGTVGINANINQNFGFDMSYSNFSMNQKATSSSIILTDSNKVFNVSHNLNVGPRFTFMDEKKVQSIVGNYNLQIFNDKNAESSSMADNMSHFGSVNYNVSLISSGWNVFTGLNATAFDQEMTNQKQFGLSAGFSKAFIKNTLSTSLNTTYNVSLLNKVYDGGIYNLGINTAYTLKKQHTFTLNLGVLSNQSKVNESFTEFRGGLKYNFAIH